MTVVAPPIDDYQVMDAQGQPLALLGRAFLQAAGLTDPAVLAKFGLKAVWYGRYLAAGQQLRHPSGDVKTFKQSQLRIKATPIELDGWSRQYEAALSRYLLERLQLTTRPPEQIRIDVGEVCCGSPCFGCLAYRPPVA